jgi:caffeoyl-CoA O-methyltransferase
LLPEEVIEQVFIDADKTGYRDELVTRVRPGGVLLVANVPWSGQVVQGSASDDETAAPRAFNDKVAADDWVEVVVLNPFDIARAV